jgi:hypothetical protein
MIVNVVSMVGYRNREALAVARTLIKRIERGEIKAIAIAAKSHDNREEICVTGDYRDDPIQGVGIAMRMSWRLTQLADERELEQ